MCRYDTSLQGMGKRSEMSGVLGMLSVRCWSEERTKMY